MGRPAECRAPFTVEDPDGIEDAGFTVTFSAIDAVCVAEDESRL